jgi:hypothetical protein
MLDAATEDIDELFRMSNLYPKRTGLPFIVWISTGNGVQHDIRVKVSRGSKVKPSEMITVALRPMIRVVRGELSSEELSLLSEWIRLNWDVLFQYWNEEIDTVDAVERLKKV